MSRGQRLALAGVLILLTACAGLGEWTWTPERTGPALEVGVQALAVGEYDRAADQFRQLAARCEAGDDGRRALLLLATSTLDPRNPNASPAHAAGLAARYLGLPGADAADRAVAESVYLLALDRHAILVSARAAGDNMAAGSPVADTPGADTAFTDVADIAALAGDRGRFLPDVASRFEDCDMVGRDTVTTEATPVLPTMSLGSQLLRLAVERDSLGARVDQLEREIERIRTLLREGVGPDTSGNRP